MFAHHSTCLHSICYLATSLLSPRDCSLRDRHSQPPTPQTSLILQSGTWSYGFCLLNIFHSFVRLLSTSTGHAGFPSSFLPLPYSRPPSLYPLPSFTWSPKIHAWPPSGPIATLQPFSSLKNRNLIANLPFRPRPHHTHTPFGAPHYTEDSRFLK